MQKITLAQASKMLEVALAKASSAHYPPMGIAVIDEGGHLIAFARQDGASMFRFDIALAKAWGSVGMGASSRTLGERAKNNPNFFVSLSSTSAGRFLPQTGAVLVKDAAGNTVGAVGASGGTGDQDEEICLAGVLAAGFPRDLPGA